MSTSSYGSSHSVKSSSSLRSDASASAQSWFSIGSLSNFQAGGVIDSNVFAKAPRVRLCNHYGTFSVVSRRHFRVTHPKMHEILTTLY